jgi:hypothetical protein
MSATHYWRDREGGRHDCLLYSLESYAMKSDVHAVYELIEVGIHMPACMVT